VALTKEAPDQMTPDSIIAKLKEGNTRFREGRKIPRDFLAEQRATASGQFPAAVLLSCVDSRAPAEILFNLGMGDVFNARIAGNICGNSTDGTSNWLEDCNVLDVTRH
jgi:carbonic anhydrase